MSETLSPSSPVPGSVSGPDLPFIISEDQTAPTRSKALPWGSGLSERSELCRAETCQGRARRCHRHRAALSPEEMEPGSGHPSPGSSLQPPSCQRTANRCPVAGLGWGPCPRCIPQAVPTPGPLGVQGGLWAGRSGKAQERLSRQRWKKKAGVAGVVPRLPCPSAWALGEPHWGGHLRPTC